LIVKIDNLNTENKQDKLVRFPFRAQRNRLFFCYAIPRCYDIAYAKHFERL